MKRDLIFSILAISVYILGGLATFAGVGLILLMKGKDLWGLGDGDTLGYLFVCVGLVLTVLGVLVMRILRNRI
jgi:Flp pilus assembly protein TadB